MNPLAIVGATVMWVRQNMPIDPFGAALVRLSSFVGVGGRRRLIGGAAAKLELEGRRGVKLA